MCAHALCKFKALLPQVSSFPSLLVLWPPLASIGIPVHFVARLLLEVLH